MVANKASGYEGGGAFGDVGRYVRRDPAMMRPEHKPVLAMGCANVASPETWEIEAEALYSQSRAHSPPIMHWVVSWEKGETVTAADAKATFDELTKALGYEKLQAVWGLSDDGETGCPHIHVAYNGIDPSTGKADWFRQDDYARARSVCRKVEFERGFASGEKREVLERAQSLVIGARLLENPRPLLDLLTEHEAVFRAADIRKAIVEAGVEDVEQRRELLEKVSCAGRKIAEDAWTTDAVWQAEERTKRALEGLGRGFSGIAVRPSADLDEQQERAREYVLHAGSRRKLVTGVAGSGKSRTIRTIADDFRRAGYDVRAVSVTHAACEVLEKEANVPTRTVASELFRWDLDPDSQLGRKDVLIIDELSTLGTKQGVALLDCANRAGAIVLGFGDHRQFGSVGYGNLIRQWMKLDPGVDMEKTRRQNRDLADKDPEWMRKATEDMRAGRVHKALDAYRSRGFIHETATQAEARAKLVESWLRHERAGTEVAVETFSNRERIVLSLKLREAQRGLGRLSGDDVRFEVTDGLLPFAVGDRVTIRGNLKELGLRNGMAANVVGIHGTTLRLERQGRVVDLDTTASDEHRKIEHGYVRTTYREQGATRTVELSMLTRLENAASFAVGFSRHTDAFEAFFPIELVKSYERVVKMAQREIVKLSAHDVFAIEQQRQAQEQIERDQPRRRGISDEDLAAAIERAQVRKLAQEQAIAQEQERKKERSRGMGRGR